MNILIALLNFLNLSNLLSLLYFVCAKYNFYFLWIENGSLTDLICINQIAIALTINIIIGVTARVCKVPRPKTGLAIVKESRFLDKVMVSILLVCCIVACISMSLSPFQYILACILHSLGVLNCSRIIKKL